MPIFMSLGNRGLLKEFGFSRGRWREVFRGGTLIKQLEQVKCIHDVLSLRMYAAI